MHQNRLTNREFPLLFRSYQLPVAMPTKRYPSSDTRHYMNTYTSSLHERLAPLKNVFFNHASPKSSSIPSLHLMRPPCPLFRPGRRRLTIDIPLPLHLLRPIHRTLHLVCGLVSGEFSLGVGLRRLGRVRQDLAVLEDATVTAFHLGSARGSSFCSGGGCFGGASTAEKEEGCASEEEDADYTADEDAGDGAAGEMGAGGGGGRWCGGGGGEEDGCCWAGFGGCLEGRGR